MKKNNFFINQIKVYCAYISSNEEEATKKWQQPPNNKVTGTIRTCFPLREDIQHPIPQASLSLSQY